MRINNVTDYSKKESWCHFPEITKDVDTFYIFATEYAQSCYEEGAPDYAPIDNPEVMAGVNSQYELQASAYADSTNIFAPYYRQFGMKRAGEVWKETGDVEAAISGTPYDDIKAAFDYYFEHYNQGRPFILAGHSQGSAIVRYALKHYFKDHPEYYGRMIAAYAIGYSITKDDLASYPYLKFAEGETDTGVIISYNTEGIGNVKANAKTAVLLPGAISINPLNWKRDNTYAPASKNLGSFTLNEATGKLEKADLGADAQVFPERGVVVTNAACEPLPEELVPLNIEFFGPDPRHASDYTFYYSNIKDNVAKRIAAYMAEKR